MAGIHITDIEAAINWWRDRSPSPDGVTACAQVRALAEVYASMVYYREPLCDEISMPRKAQDAWLEWYASTPDAPCIAICSTSQGDALCKGCGRSFDEVQHWTAMSPAAKRTVWRRITQEATAWRFNRYAERARLASTMGGVDHPPAEALTPAAAGVSAVSANSDEAVESGGPTPSASARSASPALPASAALPLLPPASGLAP